MIVEARLVTASLLLHTVFGAPGCARARPAAGHDRAVELRDLAPSELYFERDFVDTLETVISSSTCAQSPPHAVLEAATPHARYLGFCDGRVVQHLASGGLALSSLREDLPSPRLRGWEPRLFSVAGVAMRTDVPSHAAVSVRSASGDSVRLVGKFFDLRIHFVDGSDALTPPTGCDIAESGPSYIICRRGDGYRLVTRRRFGSRVVHVASDPRLRATLRQAQEMLLSVQMMRRARAAEPSPARRLGE